ILFTPKIVGNYLAKLYVRCNMCTSPNTSSVVTVVGVCHAVKLENQSEENCGEFSFTSNSVENEQQLTLESQDEEQLINIVCRSRPLTSNKSCRLKAEIQIILDEEYQPTILEKLKLLGFVGRAELELVSKQPCKLFVSSSMTGEFNLVVANVGNLAGSFDFMFPKDVMHMFEIQPDSCLLQPSQTKTLLIKYHPRTKSSSFTTSLISTMKPFCNKKSFPIYIQFEPTMSAVPVLLQNNNVINNIVDSDGSNDSLTCSHVSGTSSISQSDGDLTSTSSTHRQLDAILDTTNQLGIEQNVLNFGTVQFNSLNTKSLKLTIKNYSRTDGCEVDITEPHAPFYISVRRASIREKSFVKLTCKFRPKKVGMFNENVILTIEKRANFKTTITLCGRCVDNGEELENIENEVRNM
ncbi:unnamed protein product, partial [Didymodactylos carnosus]